MRETLEETAFTVTLHDSITRKSKDGSTCFFLTTFDFGKTNRRTIFRNRKYYQNRVETYDYGFARKESGNWVIRDYGGTKKDNQRLRGGTQEGLEYALRPLVRPR